MDLTIHNVESIKATHVRTRNAEDKLRAYSVRDIIVTDEGGGVFQLRLFSSQNGALDVREEA